MKKARSHRPVRWKGDRAARSLALCVALCILFAVFPRSLHADDSINKKFVYSIYWTGIKAGDAVLYYQSTSDGITIKTHATSAPFLSLFYKVDDIAQSTLYPDGYPREFMLKVRQGRHKRDKMTYFIKDNGSQGQKIIFHNIRDEETTEYFFDTPAYDPLSAFYEMTKWDLNVGTSYYIHIFDSKKLWNTEIQVLRKEKVTVPAGEFDTVVVKPILESEGIFPKTGDMIIWDNSYDSNENKKWDSNSEQS